MRKVLLIAAALVVASGATLAGIDGSPHDLGGSLSTNNKICIFCHTPHNPVQTAPLWNHAKSAGTFSAYTSDTIDGTIGTWAGSGTTVSALCMGCHDGVVALGDVQNDAIGDVSLGVAMTGGAALGTDLSNDHPVSFAYQSSITGGDTTLQPAVSLTGEVLLYGGNVECSSCHDAHNYTDGAQADEPFLVQSNANSAICTACHIK